MNKLLGYNNCNFIITKIQTYRISKSIYCIVLGKNKYNDNNWVTWECYYSDRTESYHFNFGHYFTEKESALLDFYRRTYAGITRQIETDNYLREKEILENV